MNSFDPDQLRTFVAIAETGSYTRAADRVHKTQSAVSMQMKRLEESVGRPLFARVGRRNQLTGDGETLLDFAIRILRLQDEAMQTFATPSLSGLVRIGTPDDYADRFLPPILARFARTHPRVDIDVTCLSSHELNAAIEREKLDLAIITHVEGAPGGEVIRREPLHWVTSRRHCAHQIATLPMALGPITCAWRRSAELALDRLGRPYRVVYTTWNAAAIAATVLSGLAVSVLPESAIRPGMSVLTASDGFPPLPACNIALVRAINATSEPVQALAEHVTELLDNFAERSVGQNTTQINAA